MKEKEIALPLPFLKMPLDGVEVSLMSSEVNAMVGCGGSTVVRAPG